MASVTRRAQMGMSLFKKSSTGPGDAIVLERPTDRFSIQCTVTGTSKVVVRAQGSIDGRNWTNLGSAASTYTSTGVTRIDNSTSTRIVSHVRLNVSTIPSSTRTVSGWIAAKGA